MVAQKYDSKDLYTHMSLVKSVLNFHFIINYLLIIIYYVYFFNTCNYNFKLAKFAFKANANNEINVSLCNYIGIKQNWPVFIRVVTIVLGTSIIHTTCDCIMKRYYRLN